MPSCACPGGGCRPRGAPASAPTSPASDRPNFPFMPQGARAEPLAHSLFPLCAPLCACCSSSSGHPIAPARDLTALVCTQAFANTNPTGFRSLGAAAAPSKPPTALAAACPGPVCPVCHRWARLRLPIARAQIPPIACHPGSASASSPCRQMAQGGGENSNSSGGGDAKPVLQVAPGAHLAQIPVY